MLPDTFAPAAEILPSVTVSVELALGSQLPLFVTMVTFQVPSKGCWAKAGVETKPARTRTENTVAMRLKRMSQILDVCDGAPVGTQMWSKFGAPQHPRLFLRFQTHRGESGSALGTGKQPRATPIFQTPRVAAGNFPLVRRQRRGLGRELFVLRRRR